MKNVDNIFAALVLLALLLLSAWGSATLLLVVSAILFVAGLVVFRMDTFRRKLLALAAVVGSAVGVAIAIVFR
jgi:membrane protein YqaA with SNARE-associated domain